MDDHILSVNPANGDLVGAFKISTGEDVDKAVEAARAAYPSWSAICEERYQPRSTSRMRLGTTLHLFLP